MARRKNATFTLDKTYGSGHGDRTLIEVFYRRLNKLHHDDTPIPIPPESQIHPQHDVKTQTFILADFAVRKIAPIALRAVGSEALAAKLERLKPITNVKTADDAADAAGYAARIAAYAATHAVDVDAARYAATATVAASGVARAAGSGVTTARALTADSRAAFDAGSAVYAAARAVADAAELDPDATWAAVNKMLKALSTAEFDQPAAKPQIVTTSFGNVDFSKLDFTKLKF